MLYSEEFLMARIIQHSLVACKFIFVQKRQSYLFFSSVGVRSFFSCYYCSSPLPLLLRPRPHVSTLPFRLSLPSELTRGMTSDSEQNRYSLFMAPQTLLRYKNCSSSYCLLSPWCRFHLFESSCPSLVSSHCFLRGTPGLSSCREIFLSL